jgi:transposase
MYTSLREALRSSHSVNADETGCRQDGVNGQAWSFCTPKVRYYIRDPSRSHAVPESVLGSHYKGVICSDFYGGYNYHLGEHQRCWAHFLRTLHDLKMEHPDHEGLKSWAADVHGLLEQARSFHSDKRQDRVRARDRFQLQLEALAKPYVDADVPHRTLSRRIMNFSCEMFTFVEHPDVSPDNNAAERAIRPLVVLRKVTGGTRSEQGSQTLSILMSLFGTWQLSTTNTTESCRRMLDQ